MPDIPALADAAAPSAPVALLFRGDDPLLATAQVVADLEGRDGPSDHERPAHWALREDRGELQATRGFENHGDVLPVPCRPSSLAPWEGRLSDIDPGSVLGLAPCGLQIPLWPGWR